MSRRRLGRAVGWLRRWLGAALTGGAGLALRDLARMHLDSPRLGLVGDLALFFLLRAVREVMVRDAITLQPIIPPSFTFSSSGETSRLGRYSSAGCTISRRSETLELTRRPPTSP